MAGGRFVFVGGCVRDVFLKEEPKDIDAEVYGLPMEKLKQVLELLDDVSEVGKHFGVLKLRNYPIDISLPRLDTKISAGHRGFSVKIDYSISFKQAAKRRDLTINAIGYDPTRGEVLDPYKGVPDIHKRLLKPVDSKTFLEDPLRGLRVAQLASRFHMTPHASLISLCKVLNLKELPKERISEEIKKLLLMGKKPSLGLSFLKESNQLQQFFSELSSLTEALWEKTLENLDFAVSLRPQDPEKALVLMLSVLGHFLSDKNPGSFLKNFSFRDKIKIQMTITLEEGRLLLREKPIKKDSDLFWIGSRLQNKESNWHDLILLLKSLSPNDPWVVDLTKKVFSTGASHSKNLDPIVTGAHLIEKGLSPSKEFKDILNKCLKIQYEQGITDPEEILKEFF